MPGFLDGLADTVEDLFDGSDEEDEERRGRRRDEDGDHRRGHSRVRGREYDEEDEEGAPRLYGVWFVC